MSAGFAQVIVGVALPTFKLPVPVPTSVPEVAVTLKCVVPAGVELDVVNVKVDVFEESPDAKFKVLGLNTALTPNGNAPMLNVGFKLPLAPRVTVMVYVTLPLVPVVNVPL